MSSSSASLRLRIVTNIPNLTPFYLTIEYNTQVSDLRALVAAELAFGEHSTSTPPNGQHLHPSLWHDDLSELTSRLKMTLKGSTLSIEEETVAQRLGKIYGNSNPHAPAQQQIQYPTTFDHQTPPSPTTSLQEEKLFVAVMNPAAVRPTAAAPPVVDEVDKVAKRQQVEQQIRIMEPMIQMMASNPSMLASMSPELGRLLQEHPEAAREFSNPDTLREMFRAGIDPEARRDMDRSMQSQMSQIQNIPGGMGMLENMMGSVQRDLNRPGPQTAADLTEASEERAMPTPGASSNTRAVPNPWARPRPSRNSTTTDGMLNNNSMLLRGWGPGNQQQHQQFPPQLFGHPQPMMQHNAATNNTMSHEQHQSYTPLQPISVPAPPTTTSPSYAEELGIILDMGFEGVSQEQIMEILVKHNGDVDAVVLELAGAFEQDDG